MIVTEPETITDPTRPEAPSVRLIADASDADGAASVQNVRLRDGGEGASPHLHRISHEVFFVLGGTLELWDGKAVRTLRAGDAAVIPPGTEHAFGAAPRSDADILITLAPGVERFEYFRLLARVIGGSEPSSALVQRQEEFDTYPVEVPAWTAHRASGRRAP